MRKIVHVIAKQSIVLFSCLVLVSIILAPSIETKKVEAVSTNKKAHIAYEKKILSINKKWKKLFSEWGVTGTNYFTYYDLNKDGIDECFIQRVGYDVKDNTKECSGGTDVAIYTYYKGKVKKIIYSCTGGGTWGGIYFYKNCPYIDQYGRNGADEGYHSFSKIVNGLLKHSKNCSFVLDHDSYLYTYTIDGKKVSEKKYTNTVKKMTGTKGLTMYKITANNLKKQR